MRTFNFCSDTSDAVSKYEESLLKYVTKAKTNNWQEKDKWFPFLCKMFCFVLILSLYTHIHFLCLLILSRVTFYSELINMNKMANVFPEFPSIIRTSGFSPPSGLEFSPMLPVICAQDNIWVQIKFTTQIYLDLAIAAQT